MCATRSAPTPWAERVEASGDPRRLLRFKNLVFSHPQSSLRHRFRGDEGPPGAGRFEGVCPDSQARDGTSEPAREGNGPPGQEPHSRDGTDGSQVAGGRNGAAAEREKNGPLASAAAEGCRPARKSRRNTVGLRLISNSIPGQPLAPGLASYS